MASDIQDASSTVRVNGNINSDKAKSDASGALFQKATSGSVLHLPTHTLSWSVSHRRSPGGAGSRYMASVERGVA